MYTLNSITNSYPRLTFKPVQPIRLLLFAYIAGKAYIFNSKHYIIGGDLDDIKLFTYTWREVDDNLVSLRSGELVIFIGYSTCGGRGDSRIGGICRSPSIVGGYWGWMIGYFKALTGRRVTFI